MLTNRSAPPATVTPVLIYPDVRAAVAWLEAAFGFQERVRIGDAHRAQLRAGDDGAVVVADVRREQVPPTPGVVTQLIKLRVFPVLPKADQRISLTYTSVNTNDNGLIDGAGGSIFSNAMAHGPTTMAVGGRKIRRL